MTTEPVLLATIAGGVVLLALLLAAITLRTQRLLRRRITACEQSIAQFEQAIQSSATIFAATEARLKAACDQIDQLSVRQGALDATGHRAAFQQAIALMRRGASTEELMSVCGVSLGEARLIQTMYGSPAQVSREVRPN